MDAFSAPCGDEKIADPPADRALAASASATGTSGQSSQRGSSRGGGEASSSVSLTQKIEALKLAQKEAREAKRKASLELKLAKRKKSRILKKARQLSTVDLMAVLTCRSEAVTKKPSSSSSQRA